MRRSDWPAVVLLLLATLGAYWPYAGARFVTGNAERDAVAYLAVLVDACEQARAGVWPAYVGQSEARFNGGLYPQAQAPLFTLVAPLIDLAVARALGPVALLNLMLLASAGLGVLSMFALLRRGDPDAPWPAAVLAFAYVASPGVMGVLVRLDMVTSFLTIALLPWLWRALRDVWHGDEMRGGVGLGLSLGALLALHPPVALWAGTAAAGAGLVGFALQRRGARAVLVGAGVFALAAAWPLATAFGLAEGRAHAIGVAGASGWLAPEMVQGVMASVRADFPAALLPLGWTRGLPVNGWPGGDYGPASLPEAWRSSGRLPYLQLGYGLWAALGLGLWVTLARLVRRRPIDRSLVALLAAAAVLAVFLLPVPWLTQLAWSALPGVFTITKWWPAQRLYLVLASLAAPVGLVAWRAWSSQASPRARRSAALVVLALGAWSAHEAAKLTAFAATRREDNAVARLENLPLRPKDLQMSVPHKLPEYTDAAWTLSVIGADGGARRDNQAAVEAACADAPALARDPGDATLGLLRLEPGRRVVLCLRGRPPAARLEAYGDGFYRQLRTGAWISADGLELLPLFTSAAPRGVHVRLLDRSGARAPLDGVTVAPYARETLPLRVTSWVPLRVDLAGAGLASADTGLRLDTGRLFVAGYEAQVDGRPVAVEASATGRTLVPIQGDSRQVTLAYVGPPFVRVAFGVSLATWFGVALGALRRRVSAPPV